MCKFIELTVDKYMTRQVKTVSRDITMGELKDMFANDDFNAYPVSDHSQVVGLVTKFDFLKCFARTLSSMVPRYDEFMKRTVADVMIEEFVYVNTKTKLVQVLQLMVEYRVRSIPVIGSSQRLAGIISRDDVIRALGDCAAGESAPTKSTDASQSRH